LALLAPCETGSQGRHWTKRLLSSTFFIMSKTAKDPGADQSEVGLPMSFEQALRKLESIVEAMENADLPLESLLARFEEGARLAELCQARLAEAELKIQQLEKTAAGQFVSKPLSLPEEPSRA
jgi:exodeoxyribonuclease VII small subunit